MCFSWQRLNFHFTALERVIFPSLLSANMLRGALGVLSRKLACPPACPGAQACPQNATCLYARVFEPASAVALPSGLANIPRPFVFRARHLDGLHVEPGDNFRFGMNVFTPDPLVPPHLQRTFASLEDHGLGPTRARVRLVAAEVQHHDRELTAAPRKVAAVKLEFLTPTELKTHGSLATEPRFPALFGRIRDRVSTLQTLYGPGPAQFDFRAMGERAAQIQMTACAIQTSSTTRYSTRTGQTHELGGFMGTATYEGDLAEFLPWLQAAEATGVGRHAVWGQGEIRLLHIEAFDI